MMTAVIAGRLGDDVTLIEKNEKLGKKLYITGKGRCNLTNNCDVETFFNSVIRNAKFMYSSYSNFTSQDTMDFFEDAGLKLKTERGRRVFPVSDKSADVLDTLKNEIKKSKVKVLLNTEVKSASKSESDGTFSVLLSTGEELHSEKLVIACGGLSYPATGSTGDGYTLAKSFGHTITETAPSLVPFVLKEKDFCKSLSGLSPKNVELTLKVSGKEVYKEIGEMLFTHEGISGPLILTASSIVSGQIPFAENIKSDKEIICSIDWKPAVSYEQFDSRLLSIIDESPKKEIRNALHGVYPASLIPVLLCMCDIDGERKAYSLTKEDRRKIADVTKNMTFHVERSAGYKEAVVTKGGVKTFEINPKSMESKIVEGLFFAGEVIDIDALTGGFNLQLAWSSAGAAARS